MAKIIRADRSEQLGIERATIIPHRCKKTTDDVMRHPATGEQIG
jgi:hypothetical protein